MRPPFFYRDTQSFTLVELLVVIGILAILTAAVVIVLNPAELLRQSRDSKRTTDLANLNNAIKLLLTQNPDVSLGAASTVYLSLTDSSSTCGSYSLPILPGGWKYQCATSANYQKTDGGGWVPVSFASTGGVASLPALPIDPQNAGIYYYSYIPGGSWEIAGMLESKKYAAKAQNDAGVDPERFEVGSNLALWKDAYGLVRYWPMDEDGGTTVKDASGSGSNGMWHGTGIHYGAGKIGQAAKLNGTDDYVEVSTFNYPSVTVCAWFNRAQIDASNADAIFGAWRWDSDWQNQEGFDLRFYINSTSLEWQVATKNSSNIKTAGGIGFNMTSGQYNAWHHGCGTYDSQSGVSRLYLDGAVRNSENKPAGNTIVPLAIYPYMAIGYSRINDGYFNGYIDDVRIYSRALSAAEVQAIYNATQ